MSRRLPMTPEERTELARRYFEGEDDRSIKLFEWPVAGSTTWVSAYPMGMPTREHVPEGEIINPGGAVWLPGYEEDDGQCLSISEARDLARVLLQAADHAEFGPDE